MKGSIMSKEAEDRNKYLLMEKWKEKYKPLLIEKGHFPLANSLFVYASSPENLIKLEKQNENHVWSLKWGSEDIFIVRGPKLQSESGYLGYVITEIPWSSEEPDNSVVCVESPTTCESCEGLGEDEIGETCTECDGHGEFWVNYDL